MHFKDYDIELLSLSSENSEEKRNAALKICDDYLGTGLYSMDDICEICTKKHHYFYTIKHYDKIIGIFYCYAEKTDNNDILNQTNKIKYTADVTIGVARSIAILSEHRGMGVSEFVLSYCTNLLLDEEHADFIIVPAWIKNGIIPARNHLERCGYTLLDVVEKPWIHCTELRCPVCKSERCICDAALYIKRKGEKE